MNKQPEALRLAEHLELHELHVLKRQAGALCHAAAELRRLHEENERLREALKDCASLICEINGREDYHYQQAKAALQEQP